LPEQVHHIPLGLPFLELPSVDSTNNYALARIHAGMAQHGMAVFAHEQVAGKGQRGKSWVSEKDANIILSVIVQPTLFALVNPFWLSACVAVAVHHFFSAHAGPDTKIKWPNDLYWQHRKAGGILIENIIRPRQKNIPVWEWSVAGIGININQTAFPPELKNPVSLKQISGKNYNTVALAKQLCSILDNYFQQLILDGSDKIYHQYLRHLYKINDIARLKKDTRVFEALIKGVTPTGRLIIEHGVEEHLEFGDVEWL
jgi:BirA family biotin operon repressor/biotin-[acetyl-CoA-carboxylase] ligase